MRGLTMLTGLLFLGVGIYLIANGGVTFLSVAFIVGLLFIVGGLVECLTYDSYRGDKDSKDWVLIDGATTFVLGILILGNKISQEQVVLGVFALWVTITGIRHIVRAIEGYSTSKRLFKEHLFIGLVNLVGGMYVFFNGDLFNLAAITVIGIAIIVQGINIVYVGASIYVIKPNIIKTKEERLQELAQQAEEAHALAREAIQAAKDAKQELKAVAQTPEEELDLSLAPKPLTEEEQAQKAKEAAEEAERLAQEEAEKAAKEAEEAAAKAAEEAAKSSKHLDLKWE